MYYKLYTSLSRLLCKHKSVIRGINLCNKILTGIGFISYPLLIALFFFRKEKRFFPYLMIPGLSFCLVTLFRKRVNRKRPYESYEIKPLIPREKKGQSFPSRHVFSMTLIAGCWFFVCPPVGVLLLMVSVFLAVIRIISGVHYPGDVLAGGILGFLSSYLTSLVSAFF